MTEPPLDCLVIGGGAAGLVACVYLGRFRRRVALVDEGKSRLGWIPKTRNVMGFPDGIAGKDLWARMREHAANYGVTAHVGRVERLARGADGIFDATSGKQRWRARFVILATGAVDVVPELGGLAESLQAGVVRYCPVCDGYETEGQRVAVLGREVHGMRESAFLSGFANEVTWLSMDSHASLPQDALAHLRERKVAIAGGDPRHIHCAPGQGVTVEMHDGKRHEFDVLYPALGITHASELATALGARAQEDGQLEVDDHLQTTVDGLYTAGDVAVGLNQINVAAGHAAIAATAIHNRL
ncbi:NAD(P)/FAD-dependent oxidoreductase [Caenimonas aquaedulcis]|uniref:NAD(P)/FAD-dependent oxidoreductase n=1 Tax=Caenimonas aquaedulcis TaxID=2793270 RepID=A0A931MIY1_9BURK|nr:NAD(P)/FAD-dependent oxidoreductase [Caenimonas aquaedulcis]MBG9390319.1 NAD(P)/FAD-dependent oxidoreductase [Caenimonas aquaedulcis]